HHGAFGALGRGHEERGALRIHDLRLALYGAILVEPDAHPYRCRFRTLPATQHAPARLHALADRSYQKPHLACSQSTVPALGRAGDRSLALGWHLAFLDGGSGPALVGDLVQKGRDLVRVELLLLGFLSLLLRIGQLL